MSVNKDWTKASYCTTAANCVEVRGTSTQVDVRDNKDVELGYLSFRTDTWSAFVNGLTSQR